MTMTKTSGYLKNRLNGAITSEEFSPETPVQIITEDGVIYSIDEVEYEAPEAENPLDPHGTLWLKVVEI
jgi:hypothetical protein